VATVFYLDASALAKRYVPEPGSAPVHAILDTVPPSRLIVLTISIGEVVSILVRKRNAGIISQAYFDQAMANFETEVMQRADVPKASVTRRLVLGSVPLIIAYSINSTDAVTLKSALAIVRRLRAAGDELALVASDQRLLRAAQAEGLLTFDPESQDQAVLAALFGP
jgi:predicted nucleic acid-binding protein